MPPNGFRNIYPRPIAPPRPERFGGLSREPSPEASRDRLIYPLSLLDHAIAKLRAARRRRPVPRRVAPGHPSFHHHHRHAADTAETTTSSVTVAHTPTRASTLRAPKPAVRSRRRPGWLALASLTAVLSLAACGDGGTGSDAAGQSSTSGKAVSPAESTTAGADTSLAPSTLATADTESAAAPVSGHLQTKALPAIATAGSPCDTMLAATSAMLPATSAAGAGRKA